MADIRSLLQQAQAQNTPAETAPATPAAGPPGWSLVDGQWVQAAADAPNGTPLPPAPVTPQASPQPPPINAPPSAYEQFMPNLNTEQNRNTAATIPFLPFGDGFYKLNFNRLRFSIGAPSAPNPKFFATFECLESDRADVVVGQSYELVFQAVGDPKKVSGQMQTLANLICASTRQDPKTADINAIRTQLLNHDEPLGLALYCKSVNVPTKSGGMFTDRLFTSA